MTSSTLEVSYSGRREIGRVALCIQPLYIIQIIDRRSTRYAFTYSQPRTAAYSWCFQFYGICVIGYPVSYFWLLHWQRRGGLTGVSVLDVCQLVMNLMYRPPIGWISIRSLLVALLFFPP
jgi:hypothetical protein